MLVKHKGGNICLKHNCVVKKGGSMRLQNVSLMPNNPIFGLPKQQYTASSSSSNGQFLGGSIHNINFKGKKKSNIKFII